jgi:HEAT repeat protein
MPRRDRLTNSAPRAVRGKSLAWWICAAIAFGIVAPVSGQDDATALIVELLGDKDKEIRALAFEQIRSEAKGEAATLKFAGLLPSLPPETQIGLLSALAARGDRAAAPAVRELVKSSNSDLVQAAAIEALGSLGNESDVALLVSLLGGGKTTQQSAARASLERLAGDAASAAIAAASQNAPLPQRLVLIEVLKIRRSGISELLAAASDSQAEVRRAAMTALAEIAGPEHLSGMVQGVLKAESPGERVAAERAITLVCSRIADPANQAEPLLTVIGKFSTSDRILLLPTVGRIGGPKALEECEKAFHDPDPKMHAAGLAALCNWPDGSNAARLLELARTEPHPAHRTMARKALIRIAPLSDARSDARRLDLLRTLYVMCENDGERNLILQRASGIRTIESLRFVASFLEQPKFAQQACESIVELAHHRGLREPNKAEFDQALDRVLEVSKDEVVLDRAQRYKQGQTWVRPKSEKAQ